MIVYTTYIYISWDNNGEYDHNGIWCWYDGDLFLILILGSYELSSDGEEKHIPLSNWLCYGYTPFSNIKWWWIKLTKPHETSFLGHQRTVCCPSYGTGVLDPRFSKAAIFGGKLSHREWWHRQFAMGNSDDGKEQLTSKISIFRHPGLDLLPQILGHMDLILVLRSTLKHQRRTWKTFQKAEITWIER